METKQNTGRHLTLIAAALSASFATQAWGDDLPSMGEDSSPWQVDVTYENHTAHREHAGLAKFRNTMQLEADKKFGNGWGVHSILRGSWDGVYRMNSSEYGKDAGGPIMLENSSGAGGSFAVPHGGSIVQLANSNFLASNPNDGMRVLGDRWHATEGGVTFGVPVRPCDIDSRGCRDFGGYGDKTLSELEAPEFNNRLDFVRELYVKKTFSLGDGKDLFLKLGKQQVVWGRTDLFRVLDVINPVDYSRNNIYDELSDIRIPMWIAQAEYRMGASESMQDRNFQIVWNFDQFRANNLGQCGTPNVILDAGCFFRGMANLWDNGGTVSNFANGNIATDFGPHQIGIRNVYLPDWSLSNTQLGAKFEGVTAGGLSFSLNALTYRSQLPSLHSINGNGTINPFTGTNGNANPAIPVKSLIAFDMHFPRVNLIGGSMDFQLPAAGAAVRVEGAYTNGEEFANTSRSELFSKNDVFRAVIGIDRPTFIPFISETSATLISGQLFYQHIFDHEYHQAALGPVGMPDWEDNFIGTLLIKGFLRNGTLSPQIIFAHDFQAQATAMAPQVEWNVTNDLKVTFGANYKLAEGRSRWKFDDCRSCNPYPPFTGAEANVGISSGMGGMEPLGRFRAGPIGAAFKENDIFVRVNYKF
ncbi:MAG: cox2 cytochrome oxidase subunit 2 [Rhodocyclaceae bacterium]|nr:MAG: cox2 cytochrome oxidase subunit 2 [Rhodocyclaceae bacterium]